MLTLKTVIRANSKYSGKTKFMFWNDVNIDDVIELSLPLKSPGRGSNGLYTTQIKLKNITSGSTFQGSLTEISNYLSKVTYTEI